MHFITDSRVAALVVRGSCVRSIRCGACAKRHRHHCQRYPCNGNGGQIVTIAATVAGSSPTGTVNFTDGAATLTQAALVGGQTSITTGALAQGTHSITAAYAGDANNAASTSAAVSVSITSRPALTWQYGYDAMGRLSTAVDPNGLATYCYYDKLGRRIQSQQPANTGSSTPTVIDFGYSGLDGLTSVTDPRSLTTSYAPNGLATSSRSPVRTAAPRASPSARGRRPSTLPPKSPTRGHLDPWGLASLCRVWGGGTAGARPALCPERRPGQLDHCLDAAVTGDKSLLRTIATHEALLIGCPPMSSFGSHSGLL
jgi:YD repeat-containing protein